MSSKLALLPKIISRVVGSLILLAIGSKVIYSVTQHSLAEHIDQCRSFGNQVKGQTPLQQAQSIGACVEQVSSFPERMMFRSTSNLLHAMPNASCKYVGIWTSTRPGSVYRFIMGDNGNFRAEAISGGQDTSTGSWGVYQNQMVWFYPGKPTPMFPPDINPIVNEEPDRFTLVEQNGMLTQFTRLYAIDSKTCGTVGQKVNWDDDKPFDANRTNQQAAGADAASDAASYMPKRIMAPDPADLAGEYVAPAPVDAVKLSFDKNGQYTAMTNCASNDGGPVRTGSESGTLRSDDEWYAAAAEADGKAHDCRLPSRLLPLTLGGTHYLLSEARVIETVNQLNAGQPVSIEHFLQGKAGKPADASLWKPAAVAPLLPRPYNDGVKVQPVPGKISQLGTVGATSAAALLHPQGGSEVEYGTKATLNLGSRQGMFVGIQLYLAGAPSSLKITVENVLLDQSQVRLVWKGSWRPVEDAAVSTSPAGH